MFSGSIKKDQWHEMGKEKGMIKLCEKAYHKQSSL